jgi:ATPase family associated with various cellular activities (AAA)
MYTLTIPDLYQRVFLKYISSKSECKNFTVHSEQDNSTYLCPSVGKFEYGEFTISITEIGKPMNLGACVGVYTKVTVSHEDLKKVQEFVTDAYNYEADLNLDSKSMVKVYTGTSKGYFRPNGDVYAQNIDHVYIPIETKNTIINHIDCFVASKQKYTEFGRTYKTSFLLTGPPGSGKTSTVKAIALKYKKPIYVLNFTKQLTDESFVEMVSDIKKDSIILIEDIDAFFVDRSPININISFSALINFLDGVIGSCSGNIFFMSANNVSRIDPALIRPGRVDRIIEFSLPKKPEIKQAYNDLTGSMNNFHEFYDSLNKNVSMATLIEYLFRNGDNPIEGVSELSRETDINNIYN